MDNPESQDLSLIGSHPWILYTCMTLFSMFFIFGLFTMLMLMLFNLSSGSSRVMKHQWYGKCFCISTSFIHLIGTTGVQCPPSCFCMVLHLRFSMHWSVLALVSRYIMGFFVFCVSPGCTNTTSTQRMGLQSGLQNYIWVRYLWGVLVGFLIVHYVGTFLGGTLTPRDMPYGTSSWGLIHILRTHSWCFVVPSSWDGIQQLSTSWDFSHMWRFKNQKSSDRCCKQIASLFHFPPSHLEAGIWFWQMSNQ